MFWLDGSPTLPFPIISTRFLKKPCVESLAKASASIENQAKIAKSWVEIGNFNHWCHAASELVDLTNYLVAMDNDFLYYEGLISNNERLRRCSKLSSELADLVSISTFERARERLLANFKFPDLPAHILATTLPPHGNDSVNECPSSASTKTGAEVTTRSLALPRHTAASSHTTTTTTTPLGPPQHGPTSNEFEVVTATATEPPRQWTPLVQPTPALASASPECANRSFDRFANVARVARKVENRVEEREERIEERENRRERRREEAHQERCPPSKHPTPPLPLTPGRVQEPPAPPSTRQRRRRRRRRCCRYCANAPLPVTSHPGEIPQHKEDPPVVLRTHPGRKTTTKMSSFGCPYNGEPAAPPLNPDRTQRDQQRRQRRRSRRCPTAPAPAPVPAPTPAPIPQPNKQPNPIPHPVPPAPIDSHQSQRSRDFDHVTREERNRSRCRQSTAKIPFASFIPWFYTTDSWGGLIIIFFSFF
jgi:hypothetical protein